MCEESSIASIRQRTQKEYISTAETIEVRANGSYRDKVESPVLPEPASDTKIPAARSG